jgi:hypothetical protein
MLITFYNLLEAFESPEITLTSGKGREGEKLNLLGCCMRKICSQRSRMTRRYSMMTVGHRVDGTAR